MRFNNTHLNFVSLHVIKKTPMFLSYMNRSVLACSYLGQFLAKLQAHVQSFCHIWKKILHCSTVHNFQSFSSCRNETRKNMRLMNCCRILNQRIVLCEWVKSKIKNQEATSDNTNSGQADKNCDEFSAAMSKSICFRELLYGMLQL